MRVGRGLEVTRELLEGHCGSYPGEMLSYHHPWWCLSGRVSCPSLWCDMIISACVSVCDGKFAMGLHLRNVSFVSVVISHSAVTRHHRTCSSLGHTTEAMSGTALQTPTGRRECRHYPESRLHRSLYGKTNTPANKQTVVLRT